MIMLQKVSAETKDKKRMGLLHIKSATPIKLLSMIIMARNALFSCLHFKDGGEHCICHAFELLV